MPQDAIAGAQVLPVSGLSQAIGPTLREAVKRGAELARASGTLVSFDTKLRLKLWSLELARAAAEAIGPLADIVSPSDDEVEQLTGPADLDAILDLYLGHGARIVALKRRATGATIATPDRRGTLSPAPADTRLCDRRGRQLCRCVSGAFPEDRRHRCGGRPRGEGG